MKLAIVSLGCPKNQVDADVFCRALVEAGHTTVPSIEEAEAVVINTCGFIQSAKEEAIEHILDAAAAKKNDPALKIIVTGCLAERYAAQLAEEMPEVDAVVGIGQNVALPDILVRVAAGDSAAPLVCTGPKSDLPLGGPRVIGTPGHYAWLKIAEGCSNRCTYCAIPAIRGPLRSRPMDGVLAEARWLAAQGVKELVLVAQDVTAYGDDAGENQIVPLLRELDKIDGFVWIRLLYAYPERITDELLDTMRASRRIVPYLDLPIQHCDEGILRAMGRRGGAGVVRGAIARIREKLPNATLRTSLIAGFPGESEGQFEALCDFVQQVRFDRLGCFAYSPEEGPPAASMPGQVPEEDRARRADTIMRIQSAIMAEKQEARVGSTLTVVCDGYDEAEGLWLCRAASDAPEIDTNVLVESGAPLAEGGFYQVEITGTDGADLYATGPKE